MNGNFILCVAQCLTIINGGYCEGNNICARSIILPCLELQDHQNYFQIPRTIETRMIWQRGLIFVRVRLWSNLTSQSYSIERNQQSWFLVFLKSPLSSRKIIIWDYLIAFVFTYNLRALSGLTIWLTSLRLTLGNKSLITSSVLQGFLIQTN